jgi:hypothetical protein
MIPMLLIMRHVRQQAGGGGAAHAAMD